MNRRPFALIALLLCFATSATTASAATFFAPKALPRTHLFLGTDLGWGTVSRIAPPESDRDGLQFDLKALASHYWPIFVLDGGFGWQFNKRSAENMDRGFTKTLTKGFFIESSLRYGKPWGWQIGPMASYSIIGNVGLATRVPSREEIHPIHGGVQVFYEIPYPDNRMRFGARWMTDLNVANRNEHIIQASFEIGWPLFGPKPASQPRAIRNPGLTIVTKNRATKKMKLILDARSIEFDYDKDTLRPDALRRLQRLGRFLVEYAANWETLHIGGHTDERGSVEYNQRLSDGRSASVRNALIEEGIPSAKIDARGYSELQPIDPGHNEQAWQRNRRVEFEFSGVNDMDLVINGVNQATGESDE